MGGLGSCPPLIAVGEFHVQAVAAEEGPPAQWGLQAARVGDSFTNEHQALQGGLQIGAPRWGSLCRGLVGPHVSRAVQHLVGGGKAVMPLGLGLHVGLGDISLWPHKGLGGKPWGLQGLSSESQGPLDPNPIEAQPKAVLKISRF